MMIKIEFRLKKTPVLDNNKLYRLEVLPHRQNILFFVHFSFML